MVFNDISREKIGVNIRDRMMVVGSLSFTGNCSPVILRSELLARLPKLMADHFESVEGQHNDRPILLCDAKFERDEAISLCIMDASHPDIPLPARDDDVFRHARSSRGDSAQPTIADDGAVATQGLNNRDRAAGGLGA